MTTEHQTDGKIHPLIGFLRSHWLHMFIGITIFLTGLVEIWEAIENEEHNVGAHHGVGLMGLFTAVKSLGEILHGMIMAQEG